MAKKDLTPSGQIKEILKRLKELERRLKKLERRLKELEQQGSGGPPGRERNGAHEAEQFCALPVVPERTFASDVSPGRARLIQAMDKKWVNGTKLRYCFFDSGPYAGEQRQEDIVREGFVVWENVDIGIEFEEVRNLSEAEIRIGFLRGDGAWSYVGRDVIDLPGQHERTMNFGWDLTRDPRGVDTPVHEIGHTLGFPHEHQNPFAGIVWDEEAVYRHFGGPPNNWPPQTTFHNILRKLSPAEVEGTDWDPDSIMHYSFGAGLILEPADYRGGIRPERGLSEHDIAEVRRFYPPLQHGQESLLRRFELQRLSLSPGEQKNFAIEPEFTGNFKIQAVGKSDLLMVLFEDIDGELRYVKGSDDSGTSDNACIECRLRPGRRYVLRVRMFVNYGDGEAGVVMT